jgi:hypothetical protein
MNKVIKGISLTHYFVHIYNKLIELKNNLIEKLCINL